MSARIKAKDLPGPTEEELHAAIVQALTLELPHDVLIHHSPNEGKRGWLSQRNLSRHGVLKGFPDLVLLHRGRVAFLEIKTRTGRIRSEQLRVINHLKLQDFPVYVVRSVDDAINCAIEGLEL